MAAKKRVVQYELDARGTVVREWRSDGDELPDDEAALAAVEARGHTVYEILETGGFLKLYRKPAGRVYWHLQALTGNRAGDWKIHFSIRPADFALAWDTLCRIFLERRCCSGLKIETQGERWPAFQRGREITLYVLRVSDLFDEHLDDYFQLPRTLEHSEKYWLELIAATEVAFRAAGIRPNTLAVGDRAVGTYASLRNEAFVRVQYEWQLPEGWSGVDLGMGSERDQWVYPPNEAGYNASRQPCPLPTLVRRRRLARCALSAIAHGLPWILPAALVAVLAGLAMRG